MYECMILSHGGSKILTACKMLQISIAIAIAKSWSSDFGGVWDPQILKLS